MRYLFIVINCLFGLLLIANTSFAQVRKDTLFFTNGEVLIGELKELSHGLVSFDSDGTGVISIKMYKLKTIHTTVATLRIETTKHQWIYGKLVPTGNKDSIYVADSVSRIKISKYEIITIIPFRQRFVNRLDGNVSAGFSFSRSSGIGQLNINGTIKYSSRWLGMDLTGSELGSIDSSKFSRDQESLQLNSFHYIGNTRWLVAFILSYQRNEELSLEHRYQGVLALGNKILSSEYFDMMILSGLSLNQEKSFGGESTNRLLTEIPLILKLNYFKFKHPDIQISMTNSGYISMSQAGRYRYDGSISFSWELVRNFYFTNNLYANFDSKPADAGSAKIDYGVVTGISFKF